MSHSRMFGDDDSPSETASPRTTIVGGRPPEKDAATAPVPTGIQQLLRLASVDEDFKRELLEKRDEVAVAADVTLSPSERAILRSLPAAQLAAMISSLPAPPADRRTFLQQMAAAAVTVLLGLIILITA